MKIPLFDMHREIASKKGALVEKFKVFLDEGMFVLGNETRQLEDWISREVPKKSAIAVSSGTAALTLALQSLEYKTGSNIVSTSNTGGYSAIAAREAGLQVIPADVDSSNGMPNFQDIVSQVNTNTIGIVVTHLFGNVGDFSQIRDFCDEMGILLIEDVAQSFGGYTKDLIAGSFGHISTLSFYPTKNLGSLGDAGAILVEEDSLARTIIKARQYGWSEKYYIDNHYGSNYRVDELQASFLNIKKIEFRLEIARRIDILRRIRDNLPRPSNFTYVTNVENGSTAHLNVIRFYSNSHREYARNFLNSSGIQTAIHYPYLDLDQPGLNNVIKRDLPQSRSWSETILTLPLFSSMNKLEIDYLTEKIVELDQNLSDR